MEKRKPHFDLDAIKAAFAEPSKLNLTVTAARGAVALDYDNAEIVATIQALRPRDFDKSMTAYHDSKLWQDVYKPASGDIELYVKFTLDSQGQFLLISFKAR
jgi:motility quorum-sensing regulator/GCU-specific mRNA interferase toxin